MAPLSTSTLFIGLAFSTLLRAQSAGPCYSDEDPQNLDGFEGAGAFCRCNSQNAAYSAIPSKCGEASYEPCTYTSIPPSSFTITSGYVKPSDLPSCVPEITYGSVTATAGPSSQYVVASQTLTPGGPPITVASNALSLASGGSYVVVGSSTESIQLSGSRSASAPDSGLVTGSSSTTSGSSGGSQSAISTDSTSSSGSTSGSNSIISSSSSTTSSAVSVLQSTPTVPFGVYVTTISNKPYTLTYVSTTVSQATSIVESDSSLTTTSSISASGAIWAVPTSPPGWPEPGPPGPPPVEAPSPGGGGGGTNTFCLFGCGGSSGGGGGGTSLPCVIDCGNGGGGGSNGPSSNPTSSPNSQQTSGTTSSESSGSSSSSASCSKGSPVPSCANTVVLSTSFAASGSSSTVITSTSTSCTTITTCSGSGTTQLTTTSTGSSPSGGVTCTPTVPCTGGACAPYTSSISSSGSPSKRTAAPHVQRDIPLGPQLPIAKLLSIRHELFESARLLAKRLLPEPSGTDANAVNTWMSNLFNQNQVLGANQATNLIDSNDAGAYPTSRFDPFGSTAFSAGVNGLYGCTSIVVTSRKGVWTSHFWQLAGFYEGDASEPTNRPKEQVFQTYVLGALSQVPQDPKIPANSWLPLTEVPNNAFAADEHVQVFISTPAVSGDQSNTPKYANQINAITAQLPQLLLGLATGAITTFPYVPADTTQQRDNNKANTAYGKVLTNWDPDAYSNGDSGYQTWGETHVGLQDRWSSNGGACSSNQKRQNGGSCSSSAVSSGGSSSTAESSTGSSSSGFITSTSTTRNSTNTGLASTAPPSSSMNNTTSPPSSSASAPSSSSAAPPSSTAPPPPPSPTCSGSALAISSADAQNITDTWKGKSGNLCLQNGLQAIVAGLGPDQGQVMLQGSSNGCAGYSDMSASLDAIVKSCSSNGMVDGEDSIANSPGMSVATYSSEEGEGGMKKRW